MVSVIAWYGKQYDEVLPWTVVANKEDAQQIASRLRDPHPDHIGETGIGHALQKSKSQFYRAEGHNPQRLVVDIYADGDNNTGPEPAAFRDTLWAEGVIINAIVPDRPGNSAHENPPGGLPLYFERNVASGFVMSFTTYDDFSAVFRRKFVQEMTMVWPSEQ